MWSVEAAGKGYGLARGQTSPQLMMINTGGPVDDICRPQGRDRDEMRVLFGGKKIKEAKLEF